MTNSPYDEILSSWQLLFDDYGLEYEILGLDCIRSLGSHIQLLQLIEDRRSQERIMQPLDKELAKVKPWIDPDDIIDIEWASIIYFSLMRMTVDIHEALRIQFIER